MLLQLFWSFGHATVTSAVPVKSDQHAKGRDHLKRGCCSDKPLTAKVKNLRFRLDLLRIFMRHLAFLLLLLPCSLSAFATEAAQTSTPLHSTIHPTMQALEQAGRGILSSREQATLIDAIQTERLEQLLPPLMREQNIDMWLLISREYNEDPVLKTMLPASWMSARRRTMLVIYDPAAAKTATKAAATQKDTNQAVESTTASTQQRFAIARYDVGTLFKKAWDPTQQPDQWQALKQLIISKNPQRIGINQSDLFGHADGMTATELAQLKTTLGPALSQKLVSAETLAVRYLESRSALELKHYPQIAAIGHALIAAAFSNAVITPGKTSTEDVVWWLREQTKTLKLDNWFHPTVSLQRAKQNQASGDFSAKKASDIIQPGDLLHVDFGISYLRLNSDQQQHAYVLQAGETDAPEPLKQALQQGNQLQDMLTSGFRDGISGNALLRQSRDLAINSGLKPTIYSHPLGLHGHGAGPAIGMWDAQQTVPGTGDFPIRPNTAYSIELNHEVTLEGWQQPVLIMLEENGYFDGKVFKYLNNRQKSYHLIQSQ
jgi:Xaa-Pro aminopeptidase